ncbi:MAG: ATP-binding protein [Dehalococcoidia bacterium]|nr:ATP-binding protein [Dehalococcoidia bacterium]
MVEMLGSVRLRIAAFVLLIVAAFAALGVYVVRQVDSDMRANAEAYLGSQASVVANAVRPLLEDGAPQPAIDALVKRLGAGVDSRITVIAADGAVLGDSETDPATMENHGDRPEVRQALATGEGAAQRHSSTLGVDFSYVARTVFAGGGPPVVVRVAQPLAAIDSTLSDITRSIVTAVIVTGALAALLSLIVGSAIVRPLQRLAVAARNFGSGDLKGRVSPRPSGEAGEVADAFNQMAEDLDEMMSSLSEERSRLRAVLDSSSDGVVALDAEGSVTLVNRAAERLLGRQEDLLGHSLAWALPDDGALRAVQASREGKSRETAVVEQSGGRSLLLTVEPIADGGRWVSLLVLRDITESKRLEETRRDFIANVSHELRTPLASIKAVIETLQSGALDDKAAAQEFLVRADAEVDHLARMVTELLELSRLESGQAPFTKEPVDIGPVLSRAVERMRPQAERKGLRLDLDIAPGLPTIVGDAERLEQATVNLLDNAVKFTPEGGSVRVSARLADAAVEVEVTDTGIGIAREKLPRIFERFYKAGSSQVDRGTGLGLAIVKHIIESFGGTVSVDSTEGQGSTFRFSIPVADS